MNSGPYPNVENTAVDKDPVSVAPYTTVEVFAWDGDQPSIAQTWGPGSTPELDALPSGASDPDVLVIEDGTIILVAYEIGGDIELKRYENAVGGGSLTNTHTFLIPNASNPNLDKPACQYDPGQYALVYEDNTGVNDILVGYGSFFISIPPPTTTAVLPVSLAPVADPYTDRVNPDVLYIENEIYVTAVGRNSNLGGFYVDIFHVPTGGVPSITGLLNPGGSLVGPSAQVFPRIDGFQLNSPGCYEYVITYGNNNVIYSGYSSSNFGIISQGGSVSNELPAVSFKGDYHDVIWTATGPGPFSNEIIGLGSAGCVPVAYKRANTVFGPATINLYPNISGTCGDPDRADYAIIWWEQNSANIYYKYANAGTLNYKNAENAPVTEHPMETDFPTLLFKDRFNWESDKQLELEIRNLSGQLKGIYSLDEFKSHLSNIKNGLYIFKITDRTLMTTKVEKVLIK